MVHEEATRGTLGVCTAGAPTGAEKQKITQAVACQLGNLGTVRVGLCSASCLIPRPAGSARENQVVDTAGGLEQGML